MESSEFLTRLVMERVDDNGGPFKLEHPLWYRSKLLNRIIKVPSGFRTDLASIPRLLWSILPPIGKYDKAAVVHDFLYRTNGVTRNEADQALLEGMEVLNVRATQRQAIYWGVRLGGWWPWRKYRKAK